MLLTELIVAVTLYQGVQRHQSLGVIKNMFVRVVDKADDFELCNFRDKGMTEDFNTKFFRLIPFSPIAIAQASRSNA